MIAAADQEYAVFAINGNTGDIAMRPALRQLLPAFHNGILDLVCFCHAFLPR